MPAPPDHLSLVMGMQDSQRRSESVIPSVAPVLSLSKEGICFRLCLSSPT